MKLLFLANLADLLPSLYGVLCAVCDSPPSLPLRLLLLLLLLLLPLLGVGVLYVGTRKTKEGEIILGEYFFPVSPNRPRRCLNHPSSSSWSDCTTISSFLPPTIACLSTQQQPQTIALLLSDLFPPPSLSLTRTTEQQ